MPSTPRGSGPIGRHRWQALVFCTEFLYMGLELLASRLLSPWFGTTLDVWTAIISTVLVASAIGNHLGGKVADGRSCGASMLVALSLMSLSFSALPAMSQSVARRVAAGMGMSATSALVASMSLFLVPSLCIGSLTPMAVALHGRESAGDGIGRVSAGVYSAMTLGGIVGTVVTGFVLVPRLGATTLSHAMAAAASGLALAVWAGMGGRKGRLLALWAIPALAAALLVASGAVSSPPAVDGAGRVDAWQDTEYGRIHVYDVERDGKGVRILNVDGGFESAMFTEEGREDELVFDYTNAVRDVIAAHDPDCDEPVLCLGGGAYSVPRSLAAQGGSRTIDVVEIDDGVTEAARRWFRLDDAVEASGGRLRPIPGDARVFLQGDVGTYGIVFNDTFSGTVPVRTMATVEAARLVKSHLSDGGIYVSNVIGADDGETPSFLAWEVATLRQVFGNVRVTAVRDGASVSAKDNWVVVATDDMAYGLPTPSREVTVGTAGARVLTDDYAPVEWLASLG